jgi:hypothetical protein
MFRFPDMAHESPTCQVGTVAVADVSPRGKTMRDDIVIIVTIAKDKIFADLRTMDIDSYKIISI